MAHPALSALRKAVKGLLFMSEKDAPFKVVTLKVDDSLTAANVAALVDRPADSPVEEVSAPKFFADLTHAQKWHAEDDKATVRRYQDLAILIREQLTDVKVFKVGQVKVRILIAGKTSDGQWIGLETDSLET